MHDWVDRPQLETAWSTDVVYATATAGEQRMGLLNERPRREIRVNWLAKNRSLAYRLFFHLQRLTAEELLVPVYQDVAYTTAPSSGTTIACPTAHRRFYEGVQVAIVEVVPAGPTNVQVGTIAAVGPSSLTLEDPLTGDDYPAGSRVFPLITCLKNLGNAGGVITDRVYRVVAGFTEVLGNGSIPASADDDTVPAGFSTHEHPNGETYPIFRARPNWAFDVQVGMTRVGSRRPIGRFEAVDVQGDRPSFVLDFTVSALSRAEFWELLQFFDGRRGRLRPFWVGNPLVLFDAVGIGTTQVVVRAPTGGSIEDAEDLLRFVAIRLVDGTTYVRLVEGGIEEGSEEGTWELNFMDDALPALDLEDVASVTSAHLVRFATDVLEESWPTDEIAEARLSVQELQEEAEVEIEGIA